MTQKVSRAWWGDLLLHKTYLDVDVPNESEGDPQIHSGVDEDDAVVLPGSRNWKTSLNVKCFFDPASESDGSFSRRVHRANVYDLWRALRTRANGYLHPICLSDDTTGTSKVVSGVGGAILEFATAHPFAVDDRVLVRRNGLNLYGIYRITALPDSTHATTEALFTPTTPITFAINDEVYRLDEFWTAAAYQKNLGIQPEKEGAYYAREVIYPFVVGQHTYYNRISINRNTV